MKKVIFIPTYNERQNLPVLLDNLDALHLDDVRYLIVDDNSPDGTGTYADERSKKDPRINVVHRMKKDGLGRAYVAGFKEALKLGAEVVILMDADLCHDPRVIPQMLAKADAYAMVIGSRYIPGGSVSNWNWLRKKISAFGNAYSRLVLGLPIHDCTTGYVAFQRSALESVDLDHMTSNGYVMNIEIKYRILKAGGKAFEVPITFSEREVGKSKFTILSFLEAFINILRLRFQ